MSRQLDIEQLLDIWLDEGPTDTADAVFDAAVARVYRQRQRPAWRFLRREPPVNTPIKFLLAVAAIIVVAVVGGGFLLGQQPPVSGIPSPSPAPTASPSPTPSPSPSPQPRTGYGEVQGDPLRFTFTAPAGWASGGWAFTNARGFAGPAGIGVGASGAVNVPDDPCDAVGKTSDARTAEDVVADLKARDDLVVSDAVDTTLGGLSGLRVDVQVTSDFSACAPDNWIIFAEPDGSGYHAQGPSNLLSLWILEAESGPIWVDIEHFAGTPAKDLAEAQALVDSIVFTQ